MHGSLVFFNNISSLLTDTECRREQEFPNLKRHMLAYTKVKVFFYAMC